MSLDKDRKSGEIIKEHWKTDPNWPYDGCPADFMDPDGKILRAPLLEMILMSESGFTQRERGKALVSILERQRDFVEVSARESELQTYFDLIPILIEGLQDCKCEESRKALSMWDKMRPYDES